MIRRAPLLLAVVLSLGLAAPAGAVVPPRDCGTLKHGSKRYNVKADQLRCSTAKDHTKRYLSSRRKPSGYKCKRYSDSKLEFRCVKGKATFFAIRR